MYLGKKTDPVGLTNVHIRLAVIASFVLKQFLLYFVNIVCNRDV